MMPPERWDDGRLDDLAARVAENSRILARISDIREQQARFEERLDDLVDDTKLCLGEVRQMARDWAQKDEQRREKEDLQAKEQHDREREQRRERINDRRWLIGTALVVCTIVVAALGVFLG